MQMLRLQRPTTRHALRGQSVVEVALLMPLLILLLAGAVDLGNGFQTWINLTNAAREGARKAAANGDAGTICARVQEELANSNITVPCGNVAIVYPAFTSGPDDCPGTRKARCPVRVRVTYGMSTFLGSVLGWTTININAQNDMIVY